MKKLATAPRNHCSRRSAAPRQDTFCFHSEFLGKFSARPETARAMNIKQDMLLSASRGGGVQGAGQGLAGVEGRVFGFLGRTSLLTNC